MEQEATYVGVDVAKARWMLPSAPQATDGMSLVTRQESDNWYLV